MPKVSLVGGIAEEFCSRDLRLCNRDLAITFRDERVVTSETLCDIHRVFQSLHSIVEVGPRIIQCDIDDIE